MSSKDATLNALVKSFSRVMESKLTPDSLLKLLLEKAPETIRMLMETCDSVQPKQQLDSSKQVTGKSILMLQAAIKIECQGQQVVLCAITKNGNIGLIEIHQQFLCHVPQLSYQLVATKTGLQKLVVNFTKMDNELDEDSKLNQSSPLDCLRIIQATFQSSTQNQYATFLCGLLSFDLIDHYESLQQVKPGKKSCADYVFYLAESLLVFEHHSAKTRYYCNQFISPSVDSAQLSKIYFDLSQAMENLEHLINQKKLQNIATPLPPKKNSIAQNNIDYEVTVDPSAENFVEIVNQLKRNLNQGDVFQVVPSRTFSLKCHSPIESYLQLKKTNPSPYLFYLHDDNFSLFGASPETALKYNAKTNWVELYPIAGTRPRGRNAAGEIDIEVDTRLEVALKLDAKEIAEHMMLVDLARNDLAKISLPGTVQLTKLLQVDRYTQVMHLVSSVVGQLKPELDALHAYRSCLNMGTLTGAPKIRATQLIRQVEQQARGSYGGAVGYLNAYGDMDSCVVIRSAFCRDGHAHISAGAGIVLDSVAELETIETENKALAVINAIQQANAVFRQQSELSA